jgi:hypothetical protein
MLISEHPTALDAFREIDRLATEMVRTGWQDCQDL